MWSMAPMTHRIPYPLGLSACLAGLATALLVLSDAPGQATDKTKLPRVDKQTHKSYVETIPDGSKVKFDMVAIPGGVYLMGSPEGEPGREPDEGPQHAVEIRPFWMGKLEVTWDEYDRYRKEAGVPSRDDSKKQLAAVAGGADAVTGPTPPYEDETFGYGRDNQPVIAVTHRAAMEYCYWLSKKTGKLYRLPTEAEWEWACRAGTTTAYSFGDDPKKLGDYAWVEENSEDKPHEVGRKRPNPWGLHDMHGNVAEWCIDQYAKDNYAKFAKAKLSLEPVVLPGPTRYSQVARGGSWRDGPEKCRSAARVGSAKEWLKRDPQTPKSIWWMTEADYVGFRVVRAVEEQPALKGIRSKITWTSD
jgi:formylglycine-generating enzyme required for sulfatase activity